MAAARAATQNSPAAEPDKPWQFKPGQSGNPGGRPKGLAAKIRELAPPEQLAGFYLALWTRDGRRLRALGIKVSEVTLADRQRAADWLADRGYGKAPQHALVDGGDPLELDGVDSTLVSVLDELAARREAQAAAGSAPGELAHPSET